VLRLLDIPRRISQSSSDVFRPPIACRQWSARIAPY
jgi:hypothetical protein